MSKRSWNIGKITEKKAYEELIRHGFSVIRTDVDDAGIDMIAIKNCVCFLIEVKGTESQKDITNSFIKSRFSKQQRSKYVEILELFESNIPTFILLFFYRKIKNRWKYSLFLYDQSNDSFIELNINEISGRGNNNDKE